MNILGFIVETTKALAWPVFLLQIAVLYRKQFSNLLNIVTRVEYGGVEMEFKRQISGLTEDIQLRQHNLNDSIDRGIRRDLLGIAVRAPRVAALETWRHIEDRLIEVAHTAGLEVPPAVWVQSLILSYHMTEKSLINQSQDELINRLRSLQRAAARDEIQAITTEDAIKYIDLALPLIASLGPAQNGQNQALHSEAPPEVAGEI